MSERRISGPTNSNCHSWSDLTVKEIWTLAKAFFTYSFYSGLLFGVPYLLLTGLFEVTESISVPFGLPTLPQLIAWAMVGYMVYLIFQDPTYTFKYFEKMFADLAALSGTLSRLKQVALLSFIGGYMYSAAHYTDAWFLFTVLVFLPAGFTYDRYKTIICKKGVYHHLR